MRIGYVVIVGVLLAMSACGGKPEDSSAGGVATTSGIHPIITVLSGGDRLTIPVAFASSSDKPIKYALNPDDTLYHLEGTLYQNGKPAEVPSVMYDMPAFKMDQVRELAPRSFILLKYKTQYLQLSVGTYELRIMYQIYPGSVDETQSGLTPLKFEQTVILNVVKP